MEIVCSSACAEVQLLVVSLEGESGGGAWELIPFGVDALFAAAVGFVWGEKLGLYHALVEISTAELLLGEKPK